MFRDHHSKEPIVGLAPLSYNMGSFQNTPIEMKIRLVFLLLLFLYGCADISNTKVLKLGSERQALEMLKVGSLAMTKVSGAVMGNFAPKIKCHCFWPCW
ncbi:MAG: hypothetical protein KAJ23_11665 [Maribacter sp.]|nr:hypothetical protein [Maribacter sp.]